jgi:inosine-uridine nucleoside N-ribohydrolase
MCEKNITSEMRHELSMEKYLCADQFSMATAVDSSVAMETLKCYATVELHGNFSRGQLVLDHSGMLRHKPNIAVVKSVDMKKFKTFLEKCLQI